MAIHTQTKTPKNQKTKKPKNQKTKKPKKTKKTKRQDPTLCIWPPLLGVCNLVFFGFLVFCFFGFLVSWFFGFLVFCFFDLCVDNPNLAHGSDFFFVFLVFSRFWPNCKKPWKNQKKKIRPMSPARPLPRPCPWVWTFFFCFFFLFFPLLFCMFFMWRCFHHSTSQKNARLYNLHTCAPKAKLQKKKMEKPRFI